MPENPFSYGTAHLSKTHQLLRIELHHEKCAFGLTDTEYVFNVICVKHDNISPVELFLRQTKVAQQSMQINGEGCITQGLVITVSY